MSPRKRASCGFDLFVPLLILATWQAADCSRSTIQPRVIGGVDATPIVGSYLASLQRWNASEQSWRHFCTGAIYARKWIVTAGSCLDETYIEMDRVAVGKHNLALREPDELYVAPDLYVVSDGYGETELLNKTDIGLVRLSHELVFSWPNHTLRPVCFPRETFLHVVLHPTCILSGWGRSSLQHTGTADILQSVQMTAYAYGQCLKLPNMADILGLHQFCAVPTTSGQPFVGDIGAPLMCSWRNISFAVGTLSELPQNSSSVFIFMNNIRMRDWILDTKMSRSGTA